MDDFRKRVADLADRSKMAERSALTEEATKTAVVLPFIQTLGFDVFSLDEVIPEFTADVGVKKGEKVDFAIKINGALSMLIEVKPIGSKLGTSQHSQLFRYFSTTEARLAILTNGREAWFFSDTDAPNRMDKSPFFKFDLQRHDKSQVAELFRFHKDRFEIDQIIDAASNLKYTRSAANFLKGQLDEPDEDFVRLIARNIHDGMVTKSVAEQIKPAIQGALDEIIRDRIEDKLGITLGGSATSKPEPEPEEDPKNDGIVTTDEEVEAYMIVRAIGAKVCPPARINMRDAKSYCAVLMDDNNRRPVCRFYFNSEKTKYVGVFDASKNETKHSVSEPSDIYGFAKEIEEAVQAYL